MKKLLSLILVCAAAFVYANDDSFFEETDETVKYCSSIPFAAEEPVFTEDENEESSPQTCDQCEEEEVKFFLQSPTNPSACYAQGPSPMHGSYVSWRRYKANFGMEKIFIRFPQRPAVSQSSNLLTAYAYDSAVLYSLAGYYPPLGNIDPAIWFDAVLRTVDYHPYTLISHVVFQAGNGDWIMDYVTHDYIQNLIIKARAVVTRFNAYTLQCVKPNGMRDYFDYFLDNILLQRECN